MATKESQYNCQLSFDDTAIAFASRTTRELKESNWLFRLIGKPWLVGMGSKMTLFAIKMGLPVEGLIKKTMFKQFCGGTTIDESIPAIQKLIKNDVQTILDYGAEAKDEEDSLEETAQYLVKTIRYAATHPDTNIISSKITGLIRIHLLEKVNAGQSLSSVENQEWIRGRRRVRFICKNAHENDIQVYFDAEESWIQDTIDRIVTEMMEQYNKESAIVFNTVQLYRHDRLAFLKKSHERAKEKNYLLGIKLVRGAYMEKERKRAEEMDYPSPIQANKAATDRDYNAALAFCLQNLERISFCNATHNEQSCLELCSQLELLDSSNKHPHIVSAQLYGMSDHISFNMAAAGFNVAKYMPYGPVADVVPYLIRRAQENTSVGGQMGRELGLIKKELKRRSLRDS